LSGSAEKMFSTEGETLDGVGRGGGRRREDEDVEATRLGGGGLLSFRAICSTERCLRLRSISNGMASARLVPINCDVPSTVLLMQDRL
jgi:hypothetical protein